jgi:2-polyprenyl-3-methyl-5-hydroxy-6-metoxy-1,4-benzoquinol methylase
MTATTNHPDYFANHQYKLRFPWNLYHKPIISGFRAALGSCLGPDVLNVGAGPFLEFSSIDARDRRITICDTDPRAIEAAKRLHGTRLASADVVEPSGQLPYDNGQFDLVASMDVIEHLPEEALLPWLKDLRRVTKPGGLLFLTTPNYASQGLVTLEQTVLELIARRHGFSRKNLHPSKMTPTRLSALLAAAGWDDADVQRLALGWVLTVQVRNTREAQVGREERRQTRSELRDKLASLEDRSELEDLPLPASA